MNPVVVLLASGMVAPALALLPVAVTTLDSARDSAGESVASTAVVQQPAANRLAPAETEPARDNKALRFGDLVPLKQAEDRANQVRIEQRVIIRITPGPISRAPTIADRRRGLFAGIDDRPAPRLVERHTAQCLPVAGIVGVQPEGASRLILFMRDQRLLSARLEKGCNARDYYSGFLVERTGDGMICAARDKLLSRTGSHCAVNKLYQLVELDPDE